VRDDGGRERALSRALRLCGQVVARGHIAVLDAFERGALGGTGRSFDWSVAAAVAESYDFMLAGGLTPENVGQAIATAHPWGVDVSSGVETGGVKDAAKIVAFAAQVRLAG
jgi:phosphoribosylanthranilate isomerase